MYSGNSDYINPYFSISTYKDEKDFNNLKDLTYLALKTTKNCHACNGKGWVDSMYKGACKCPVCDGIGEINIKFNNIY